MKMMRNSLMSFAYLAAILAFLAVPASLFAKPGTEDPVDTLEEPVNTDGPLLDKMSDSGTLFGDLYMIARYKGGDETKKVPEFGADGKPVYGPITWIDPDGGIHQITVQKLTNETADGEPIKAVGGEPILTEDYASVLVDEEITVEPGMIVVTSPEGNQYIVSPFPSQCVQPVADHGRWGDILSKSGLSDNRIPLKMTYDPTWKRTECEPLPELFLDGEPDGETWNGITYYKDIYWADLVQEVEFGRLNLARAPKAVLDASFDEAIRSLNAAKDIKIDASGRLMVTTDIYDEFLLEWVVDENNVSTLQPLLLETVVKAIDSPKENLALYVKLMEDGHLITPAAERAPIDFSLNGGIPVDALVALEDGPSDAPRPTIDIEKMKKFGLGHLVDAADADIVCYYIKREADGSLYLTDLGDMVITTVACLEDGTCACPVGEICEKGILDPSENDVCAGPDFPLAASFFAAAADKKGNITVDKIFYINSILGINKVVGKVYEDGKLLVNYAKNPVYYNYNTIPVYDRLNTFGVPDGNGNCNANRGRAQEGQPDDNPVYDGMFEFLETKSDDTVKFKIWDHIEDSIVVRVFDVNIDYDENGVSELIVDPAPPQTEDIGGFTSMADDDLQVIKFTHTYQIPGLR